MKISHLLGQYLLQNKKMELQGIGVFILDSFYDNPFENEKGKIKLPENAIQFISDKKTKEGEGIVDFIAQRTGKIKPLAASDLEDFLSIGKQLLNVSKQFYIEGLGKLILNDSGEYDFIQGNEAITFTSAAEDHDSKKHKTKKTDPVNDISFEEEFSKQAQRPKNILRKILISFALVLGLTILGWISYYFFQQWQLAKNNKAAKPQNVQPVIPALPQTDSSLQAKADSLAATQIAAADSNNKYKVIIEIARQPRATNRFKDLQKMGFNVQLSTEDSITFKIYTVLSGPLADTTRSRDSISRFFGRKAMIELK
ncbi:MAG TPA: hypothetical protein VFV68_09615 [Agriterribacter sp.]|nr:hypothetical protein [Agriterribacter sp.]